MGRNGIVKIGHDREIFLRPPQAKHSKRSHAKFIHASGTTVNHTKKMDLYHYKFKARTIRICMLYSYK